MTQLRLRRQPRCRGGRRSGRNVWVNENINSAPAQNTLISIPLLSAAVDFMTFDTTIVEVIVTDLAFTAQVDDSGGTINTRWALITGHDQLNAADFDALFADTVGPAWMYVGGAHALSTINSLVTLPYAGGPFGPIRAKSKRRFKQNNTTLFMLFQTVVEAGTNLSNVRLSGMTRTLLHLP